jgi:hypothetical protein
MNVETDHIYVYLYVLYVYSSKMYVPEYLIFFQMFIICVRADTYIACVHFCFIHDTFSHVYVHTHTCITC